MLRRLVIGFTTAALVAAPGCSDSDLPSVPPPPPAGTVKAAPPATALPKDFPRTRGKPAPTTPTAL